MLNYPDELAPTNRNTALVDSDHVRGGRRVVDDRAALYALASKADQLKAGVTIVRVLSESTDLLLVDATKIGEAGGWQADGDTSLTSDQLAAITGADSPSAGNVLVTETYLASQLQETETILMFLPDNSLEKYGTANASDAFQAPAGSIVRIQSNNFVLPDQVLFQRFTNTAADLQIFCGGATLYAGQGLPGSNFYLGRQKGQVTFYNGILNLTDAPVQFNTYAYVGGTYKFVQCSFLNTSTAANSGYMLIGHSSTVVLEDCQISANITVELETYQAPGHPATTGKLILRGTTTGTIGSWPVGTIDERGSAPAATTGIDYANPVTLNAAATLQVNKAYYATGSGYALTLPDASQNLGTAIFVEIAATATGLYPVSGSSLTLYAAETMLVRATLGGWKKAGGELIAMETRLETALSQQDALYDGFFVPFTVPKNTNFAALADTSAHGVQVQRTGRASVQFGTVLNNVVGTYLYVQVQAVLPNNGGTVALGGNFVTIASNQGSNTANVTVSVPTRSYQAGTFIRAQFFVPGGNSANIQGGYDGNQAYLTYSETV